MMSWARVAALVVVELLVDCRGGLAGEVRVLRIGRDAAFAVAADAALGNGGAELGPARQIAQQARAPGDLGGGLRPGARSSAAAQRASPAAIRPPGKSP